MDLRFQGLSEFGRCLEKQLLCRASLGGSCCWLVKVPCAQGETHLASGAKLKATAVTSKLRWLICLVTSFEEQPKLFCFEAEPYYAFQADLGSALTSRLPEL